MTAGDDDRLVARVARLYHEGGVKQPEIARRLGLSQVKVSRLLKLAIDRGVVRITVRTPTGVHAELEEAIEAKYGLLEAIVVETSALDEPIMMRDLGVAAAAAVERLVGPGDVIGISSWSASLLATVNAMHPVIGAQNIRVVQVLGGVGNPAAEEHAAELTRRLAELLRAEPILLPVPGVVGSADARIVLEGDAHVRRALDLFPHVTMALVGIGTIDPSPVLARSGNVFAPEALDEVRRAGGVGDICLRFFDEQGGAIANPIDERVIGMTLAQLRCVPCSIAVAGGARKARAIASALRGGLINHLVIDHHTAQELVA